MKVYQLIATVAAGALLAAGQPARPQAVRSEVELTTKTAGSAESALCDYVADAIRAAGKADAAVIAASSFSENVTLKSPTSATDIAGSLDYRNDAVVVVKVTGDDLIKALEHGLFLYPRYNSGFLQVSGISLTFDAAAPREHRILSAKIAGEPVDKSRTYKVAMPAPLASGALGYFKYWKKPDTGKDAGITLGDAVAQYAATHAAFGKGDDRLVAHAKP